VGTTARWKHLSFGEEKGKEKEIRNKNPRITEKPSAFGLDGFVAKAIERHCGNLVARCLTKVHSRSSRLFSCWTPCLTQKISNAKRQHLKQGKAKYRRFYCLLEVSIICLYSSDEAACTLRCC